MILKERFCQKVDFEIWFAPHYGFSAKLIPDYCNFQKTAVSLYAKIVTFQGPPKVTKSTGGPPLTQNSLKWFRLPRFFAYVCASGGFSVSRGPQYSPTNMNFM